MLPCFANTVWRARKLFCHEVSDGIVARLMSFGNVCGCLLVSDERSLRSCPKLRMCWGRGADRTRRAPPGWLRSGVMTRCTGLGVERAARAGDLPPRMLRASHANLDRPGDANQSGLSSKSSSSASASYSARTRSYSGLHGRSTRT